MRLRFPDERPGRGQSVPLPRCEQLEFTDTVTTGQVATLARDAAGVLETHGWCQGVPMDPQGKLCLSAAIVGLTIPPQPLVHTFDKYRLAKQQSVHVANKLVYELAKWLDIRCYDGGYCCAALARWNDRSERTTFEVVNTLEKFADEIDPPPTPLPRPVLSSQPWSESTQSADANSHVTS